VQAKGVRFCKICKILVVSILHICKPDTVSSYPMLQRHGMRRTGQAYATSEHYVHTQNRWTGQVAQDFEATSAGNTADGREKLLNLYRKGKRQQWDTDTRIDLVAGPRPENPAGLPDEIISTSARPRGIASTPRAHPPAAPPAGLAVSQFLTARQGALVCTAKIGAAGPTIDAKFYAATPGDGRGPPRRGLLAPAAREVRTGLSHQPPPEEPGSKTPCAIRAWDMTYLGMQVLIEGVALAAFGLIRDYARNPLSKSVTAT